MVRSRREIRQADARRLYSFTLAQDERRDAKEREQGLGELHDSPLSEPADDVPAGQPGAEDATGPLPRRYR
jgi:hypothetical protein